MTTDWEKIEFLFHAALAYPEEQRRAFVDAQCGNDAALGGAVLSLLAHAGDGTELDRIVENVESAMLIGDSATAEKRIGSYELLRVLGQGGMGSVHLARRSDDEFQQQVAIKLIRPGAASKELIHRFQVERQILANLQHPNIARLLDGGSTTAGQPYIVLEYVQGIPIDQYCEQRGLDIRARLRIFLKVCRAVHYAHQQLVIHRDLKPTNILVAEDGEPHLLDFGIAKLLNVSGQRHSVVETRADGRLFTPHYSSPEQIRGLPVTTTTDVYALGTILYELLTRRRPFGKWETDPYGEEQAVLHTTPEQPSICAGSSGSEGSMGTQAASERRTRSWRNQLRGDLDNIILMALRKEPGRRYQSVAQLAEDIERYLDKRPVSARPSSWLYRSTKFVIRNPIVSGLGAVLAVSVLIFSLTTWLQSQALEKERDTALREGAKTEAIAKFLTGMFSDASPYKAQGDAVLVRDVLDRAAADLDAIDHPLAKQPRTEAAIRRVMGRVYLDLGLLPSAEEQLNRALRLHRESGIPDPKEYLVALLELAALLGQQSRLDDLLSLTQESLAISRRLFGENHRHTLGIQHNLAGVYNDTGRHREAEQIHLDVYRKRLELLGEDHQDTIASVVGLAVLYHWEKRFGESETMYQKCLKFRHQMLGETHPDTLYCLSGLGALYKDWGKWESAEKRLTEHITLAEKVLGNQHPETLRPRHNLADLYRKQEKYARAESLFRQVLQDRRRVLGDNHYDTLNTQSKLGWLLLENRRLTAAEPILRDAWERQLNTLGEEHAKTQETKELLLRLLEESGVRTP